MSETPRADARAVAQAAQTVRMTVQEHIEAAARWESRAHLTTNEVAALLRASIHASLAAVKANGSYSTPTEEAER